MRFPGVKRIRAELKMEQDALRRMFTREDLIDRDSVDFAGVDVRLQVHEDGGFSIHTGSSDYDQDHRGFWGASSLSYDRQNLTELAKELISQAEDDYYGQVDVPGGRMITCGQKGGK